MSKTERIEIKSQIKLIKKYRTVKTNLVKTLRTNECFLFVLDGDKMRNLSSTCLKWKIVIVVVR